MGSLHELQQRVNAFQIAIRKEAIQGALVAQRADTLYFTGTAQDEHVYIPNIGQPLVLAFKDAERAREECPWEVVKLQGYSKLPQQIMSAGHNKLEKIGLEFDVLPVANFERYKKAFADTTFVDISSTLRNVRAIKSPWEISQIEKGCAIYAEMIDHISRHLRPGMSEAELESIAAYKARLLGNEPMLRLRGFGSAFHFGTVTAGTRAAVPSYFNGPIGGLGVSASMSMGASQHSIEPGEAIVADIGIVINGYHSDVTRMLVIGDVNKKLRKAYEFSLAIEEQVRKLLVPGRVAGDIYDEVTAWVSSETPYAHNFMGFGASQVRFVGHGIGLELDELPTISKGSREIIKLGMVIAVEPKFIFPGEGAIGIEDSFLVEDLAGARCLSTMSKDIIRV